MLRKNVVMTLVILASLCIGIGANSAIFSVVDALLLRPLPYPHPDRLAAVWLHSPGIGILRDWPSPGQYIDLQNQNHSFDQMAIAQSRTFTLTGREQPERVDVLSAQSSLLTMFGAKPLLGRTFLPEEDKPGSGILYDLGSHIIDQALYFFGPPKYMIADVRRQRPHARIDDYFDLRLDYGDLRVILKSGMLIREPGPRFMVHGTLGSFIKYGEDPQEAKLRAGESPLQPHWGEEDPENYGLLHTEINGTVVRERYPSLPGNFGGYYINLLKTLTEGSPLLEKPEHGYNTIRMIELALQSSASGCRVECTGLM